MGQNLWRAVVFAAAVAVAPSAFAEEQRAGRVTFNAPGEARTPPAREVDFMRTLLAIDHGAQRCELRAQDLGARPGVTQAVVNKAITDDVESFLLASGVVESYGRRESSDITAIDGVAVVDMTLTGLGSSQPAYTRVRLFVLVAPDGSGRAHELSCHIARQPTDTQRADIAAVLTSLRIAP